MCRPAVTPIRDRFPQLDATVPSSRCTFTQASRNEVTEVSPKIIVLAFVVTLTAPNARAEPIRFGTRAGLTAAWLSEANFPILGATAGGWASIPVAGESLFFEPELGFSMKGGSWTGLDSGGGDKHYDYIELPLLLHYGPPLGFFAAVGVAPAVLVHEWRRSGGDVLASKARPFDLSVVGDLGGQWDHFRFDFRVEVGVVQADTIDSQAPPASKTRALTFSTGWLF